MANEVKLQPDIKPITKEEIDAALELLAEAHRRRGSAIFVVSGAAGIMLTEGPRTEIETMARWFSTRITKMNNEHFNEIWSAKEKKE